MIAVGAFIFWEDYGWAQTMIMLSMSFANLCILIGSKPFKSEYTNKVELANEIIVYLCCIINMMFANTAVPLSLMSKMAIFMIFICLFNVG